MIIKCSKRSIWSRLTNNESKSQPISEGCFNQADFINVYYACGIFITVCTVLSYVVLLCSVELGACVICAILIMHAVALGGDRDSNWVHLTLRIGYQKYAQINTFEITNLGLVKKNLGLYISGQNPAARPTWASFVMQVAAVRTLTRKLFLCFILAVDKKHSIPIKFPPPQVIINNTLHWANRSSSVPETASFWSCENGREGCYARGSVW